MDKITKLEDNISQSLDQAVSSIKQDIILEQRIKTQEQFDEMRTLLYGHLTRFQEVEDKIFSNTLIVKNDLALLRSEIFFI